MGRWGASTSKSIRETSHYSNPVTAKFYNF
jgi:hypothetical protein